MSRSHPFLPAAILAASTFLLPGVARAADTDADSLEDDWEITWFGSTDATSGVDDPDGDGLHNSTEELLGTDPTSADTDGDGVADAVEVGRAGDADPSTITDPLNPDTDADGLLDGQEDINGNGARNRSETDPDNADSDADGLLDGEEDADHDAVLDPDETDPLTADSDEGGTGDGDEVSQGTDPLNSRDDWDGDLDLDGLSNHDEGLAGTDPNNPDSDGDTIPDVVEVGDDPSAPANTDGDLLIDALDPDSDNDTILDSTEVGDDPDNPRDTDHDGESDYMDLDSDGGGTEDKLEANWYSTDPLDPTDDGKGRLESGASIRGGCSTAPTTPSWPGLLALLAVAAVASRRRWAGLVGLGFLVPAAAHAQTDPSASNASIDANPYRLDPSGNSLLSVPNAQIIPNMDMNGFLYVQHVTGPIRVVDQDGATLRSLVANREQLDLGLTMGILDRFELGAYMPFIIHQEGELPGYGMGSVDTAGLGSLSLHTKAGILSPARLPVGLALMAPITLPTGNTDAWMASSGMAVEPRVVLSSVVGPIHMALAGGYLYQSDTDVFDVHDGDKLTTKAGLTYSPEGSTWDVGLDFNGHASALAPFEDPAESVAELMAGARLWSEDGVLVTVGAGSGLTSGVASPAFHLVLGVSYKRNPKPRARPRVQVEHPDQINILDFYEVLPAGGDALRATDLGTAPRQPTPENRPRLAPDHQATAAEITASFQTVASSRLPVDLPARIYFSANTTALGPEAEETCKMILKAMLETPETQLLVLGYADSLGADEINLRVSLQRARAVRDWLVAHAPQGSDLAQRIDVVGMGADDPLQDEITLGGRTQNRRVEFKVKPR